MSLPLLHLSSKIVELDNNESFSYQHFFNEYDIKLLKLVSFCSLQNQSISNYVVNFANRSKQSTAKYFNYYLISNSYKSEDIINNKMLKLKVHLSSVFLVFYYALIQNSINSKDGNLEGFIISINLCMDSLTELLAYNKLRAESLSEKVNKDIINEISTNPNEEDEVDKKDLISLPLGLLETLALLVDHRNSKKIVLYTNNNHSEILELKVRFNKFIKSIQESIITIKSCMNKYNSIDEKAKNHKFINSIIIKPKEVDLIIKYTKQIQLLLSSEISDKTD